MLKSIASTLKGSVAPEALALWGLLLLAIALMAVAAPVPSTPVNEGLPSIQPPSVTDKLTEQVTAKSSKIGNEVTIVFPDVPEIQPKDGTGVDDVAGKLLKKPTSISLQDEANL